MFPGYFSNDIEKLDITNEAKGLQIINITNNNEFLSRSSANCFEISSGIILIFGGKNKTELDNCFTINQSDQISFHSSKLPLPEVFIPHVQPLIDSNKAYALSSQFRLCCFDFASQTWSHINYNSWPIY